jgi:integrase
MAHIRSYDTQRKRKGKVQKRYEVCWREPATDANGLPIPGRMRSRQESYPTREAAEARRDELNAAKHTTGTSALADQRKAGAQKFAYYAAAWLAEQRRRHAEGTLKIGTLDNYERVIAHDVLPRLGGKAIGAITLVDCEQFRADLAARLSRRSVQNVWWPFAAVFRYAQRAGAITASPADAIDRAATRRTASAAEGFEHRPLTGSQVAALALKVGELSDPVYELLVLLMCYTGLRRAEVQGLEVRDLTMTHGANGIRGSVRVQRTKTRRRAEWLTGTPKSKTSRRTVPLPSWLAERMGRYLAEHPRADEQTAPLLPRRFVGGARRKGERAEVRLDWSEPCDLQGLQSKVIRPALEAVGLPASRPDGTKGVRMHDFRHTAAVLWLTADVNFMQVAKWLGHASYVITMTVYADYMPDEDAANPLPEPVPAKAGADKVTKLFG